MSRTTSYGEDRISMNRYRFLVDVLIVMFGISAWIGVNGIYVQLPLLVASAPEGWSLPAYIVIIVQTANLGPILYALSRRLAPNLCNESRWISSLLVIGSIAMGFLAFFYDVKTDVNGAEHSVVMLILVFATALVGCSSSILFIPYLRNFDEVHLVSFFVGEGLSGLLSSAMALVQGVGDNPTACQENIYNSTDTQSVVSVPNFSSRVYFLLLFAILTSSTCAFWLLDYLRVTCSQTTSFLRYISQDPSRLDDCPTSAKKILSENTTDFSEPLDQGSTRSGIYSKISKGYLYALMGLICWAGNGFLPGIQSYSCLPYGNLAYHLTVTLGHLANPAACLLALWFPSLGLYGITAISALAVTAGSHVTWLAFMSPTPPWRDTTFGIVLVIVAWILLVGLVTYAKLSITAIFRREPGAKALFYVGIVTQAGSAAGAIFSFVLINYSNLLTPYVANCEPPR